VAKRGVVPQNGQSSRNRQPRGHAVTRRGGLGEPHANPNNCRTDFTDLATLGGDLRTALHYEQYLNGRETIDAPIAANAGMVVLAIVVDS
jgi:hypothetical protein